MSELSFNKVDIQLDIEQSSRPSLSYWQDAWRRLRANKRAMWSLYTLIFMFLFAFLGPQIYRVDPADQNRDWVSKPPWASSSTLQLQLGLWPGVQGQLPAADESHTAPKAIKLHGTATTQSVRLSWDAVPNATHYRIYRNVFPAEEGKPLGLPLGTTKGQLTVSFEDILDLMARIYWYTIVPLDASGSEMSRGTTKEIEVLLVQDAVRQNLIPVGVEVIELESGAVPYYPLGTDYLGRDMLARLMKGAEISLLIGIIAPLFFVIGGVVYGSISGFFGGLVDNVMMRFADFVIALPFLLFMILFRFVFDIQSGESGIIAMVIALIVLSWPGTARLVRGEILKIREQGYVEASRLLGTGTGRLIMRHMIPNTLGVVLVTFTFAVPSTIFTEAFLSFIGMGVVPPTPSWGSMCNDGIRTMEITPHELLFPALFISVTVLAFNLLGDGLRDALDARMRATE